MVISDFEYNELIKENGKKEIKRRGQIRRITSMAASETP